MTDLVNASVLVGYPALVTELGGNPEDVLRQCGIPIAAIGDEHRMIPYKAAVAAIGKAALALGLPDFGLILASRQGIGVLGPVAVLIRHSETVGAAVRGVCRYLDRCAPPDVAALEWTSQTATFTFDTALRQIAYRDYYIEKSLGVALKAFRLMIGEDFVPTRVTMRHRPLSAPERYRTFFDRRVEFGAPANAILFPADLLDLPIKGRDASALALAENYLAQSDPSLSLIDYVRETILRLMKVDHVALLSVADAMALHPRVLQRRLAETGTSFEKILDELRLEMAWELSASGLQASQIASRLGYSEQSSYSRACRRWFGESPRNLIAIKRRERMIEPDRHPVDRVHRG